MALCGAILFFVPYFDLRACIYLLFDIDITLNYKKNMIHLKL